MSTKKHFARIMMAALLACLAASTAGAAPSLKALLVNGQNNHDWKAGSPIIRTALEDTGIFTVDEATTPPAGGDMSGFTPDFAAYNVIVLDYNGDDWPESTRKAFVDYVANGGGVVVVHAANNAFPEWPEYNEIIGLGGWGNRNERHGPYVYLNDAGGTVRDDSPGPGGGHGKQHDFQIVHRVTDHPITRGLPEKWTHHQDELYHLLRGPAKNMTILATAYDDPAFNGKGRHEPILFTVAYGKGRMFQTALGHPGGESPALQCAGFLTTLQRGAEWAATGDVTQEVPEDFPGPDSISLRPNFRRNTLAPLVPALKRYRYGDSLEPLAALEDLGRATTRDGKPLDALEAAYVDVLRSDASLDAKKFACIQLGLYGTAKAVPVLEAMLKDAATSDIARLALQRIPDEAAGAALRDALGTTSGNVLVGIISSLGARRDTQSQTVQNLIAMLITGEEEAALAAVSALGDIGNAEAAEMLAAARKDAQRPAVRERMAESLLRCAQRFEAEGNKYDARKIYTSLYTPEESTPVRAAALTGMILTDAPYGGFSVALNALKGDDPVLWAAAAGAVRRNPKYLDSQKLATRMARLSPAAQVLVLGALADTGERKYAPLFLTAAESENPVLRDAGMAALAKVKHPNTVAPLVALALRLDGPGKAAARDALARMPGAGGAVREAVKDALDRGDTPLLNELLVTIGARGMANEMLPQLAEVSRLHPETRDGAIAALATASKPMALSAFLTVVPEFTESQQDALARAMTGIAERLVPGKSRTEPIIGFAEKPVGPEVTQFATRVLGMIGDDSALPYLRNSSTLDDNSTALEALGNWPTPAPLADLRELAKSPRPATAALALKGYVRLLGLPSDRLAEETVALYAEALAMAATPETRAAVLGGMGATGNAAALPALYDALKGGDPALAKAALEALANWPDAAPLETVAAVARDRDAPLRVDALRGFVRLIGLDRTRPAGGTAALFSEAMDLAPNADERKRIMSALGNTGNVGALTLAARHFDDPELRAEAAVAAVNIAKTTIGTHPDQTAEVLRTLEAQSDSDSVKRQCAELVGQLAKFEDYLTAWLVAGPYMKDDLDADKLFDVVFPPEEEGAAVDWQPAAVGTHGLPYVVELDKSLGGDKRVAYLRTNVWSDEARDALLELGSDDGVKAWLNGKVVAADNAVRPVAPGQTKAPVTLNQGWNTLLLKVTQGGGQWAVCARFRAPDGGALSGLRAAASMD